MSPLLPDLASEIKVLSITWNTELDLLACAGLTPCDRGVLSVNSVDVSRNVIF